MPGVSSVVDVGRLEWMLPSSMVSYISWTFVLLSLNFEVIDVLKVTGKGDWAAKNYPGAGG
jgi:hypothetical protein